MKKFFSQINKKNRGFTLVETLVAVSIFTMSILALLSVLTQSITNTYYAKQKITGAYLAQEGIEYIRNMRDTMMLYSSDGFPLTGWNFFTFIASACRTNGVGCYFDGRDLNFTVHSSQIATVQTIFNCPASACPQLLYDSNNGKYGYLAGSNSGFTRKIQIDPISINEVKVFSTVSWKQGSGDYSMTFSESLFNWIE